jgi:hypothetical protein
MLAAVADFICCAVTHVSVLAPALLKDYSRNRGVDLCCHQNAVVAERGRVVNRGLIETAATTKTWQGIFAKLALRHRSTSLMSIVLRLQQFSFIILLAIILVLFNV